MHRVTVPNIYNYLSCLDDNLDISQDYAAIKEYCIEKGYVLPVLPVNSKKFKVTEEGLVFLENIEDQYGCNQNI